MTYCVILQNIFFNLQAKYYARSNGDSTKYERRDSDHHKVLVYSMPYTNNDQDTAIIMLVTLFCTLNFAFAIVAIYSISKLLKQSVFYCKRNSDLFTTKELDSVYWATVLVCAIINIVCTVVTHCELGFGTVLQLPLKFLIFLIEIISIWFKDFKIRDSICCFTNRYVLRAIHTLAICHILWFLHRVGCSLLVAIFFIALAPAQTLAAISLIYFVILCTIAYVAFNIHFINKMRCCTKQSCKIGCKLFTLFLLYTCIIGAVVSLTFIFNQLAKNGLTSSGLGSVVLSLVAPTIVFIITLQIKQYFMKHFSAANGSKLTSTLDGGESSLQASEGVISNTEKTGSVDDTTEVNEITDGTSDVDSLDMQ